MNERGFKQFQTRIVDTLTSTTARNSVDLTFAAASYGTDVDPDVAIFMNRVLGLRRARVIGNDNKEMVDEIM